MSKFLSLMTLAATGALMLCSPVSATTASETAGEGKVFTAEAMHKLYRIGGIQLSPDGKHFIYTRTMAQLEQNNFYSEIMVGETGKPGSGRAILGKNAGHSPIFLDDQTIAFVSTKGDKAQIALCNLDGSNLRVVSDYDFDVIDFLYSPDRKKVVVIREVMLPEISKEENPDLGKQTGHIYDDLMYKHWDEWNVSVPQSFIATVGTDGNVSKELRSILNEGELFELPTKPFGGTEQLSWTKDSKQIAYSCRKKVGKEYAVSTNTDIYLFDLQSGKTTNLTEGMMGYDTNPTFSPDGTKLAWLSMEHDGCESDLPRIFVMDMKSGKKTFVSKDYEYYPQQLGWCSCGKKLRFVTPDHGTSNLFSINIETGKAEQMTKYDLADVTGFAGEGKEMLLTIQSMAEPTSAFAYDVARGEATKLTPDNDAFLADYPNVTVQRHIVKTTDGKDMITWFILPPNFDPSKKYPTVLFCEGGPQSPVT
ncbi:peptidase S9, partial [uncultured Porphyromonas sp.]|uniref:TolB family protein n=1 Tax=uncultured Porphyromonas sp. TaxID=159274 RepID=UPI0025E2CE28